MFYPLHKTPTFAQFERGHGGSLTPNLLEMIILGFELVTSRF